LVHLRVSFGNSIIGIAVESRTFTVELLLWSFCDKDLQLRRVLAIMIKGYVWYGVIAFVME